MYLPIDKPIISTPGTPENGYRMKFKTLETIDPYVFGAFRIAYLGFWNDIRWQTQCFIPFILMLLFNN